METTTNGKTITDALSVLRRYVGKGSKALPALACVELRAADDGNVLTLRRSNLETDVTVQVHAKTDDEGSVIVDATALADAIGKASGPITIGTDGERLTITTETGTASIIIPKTDFPTYGTHVYRPLTAIAEDRYAAVLSVTGASASGYDARAVLTGVYFDAEASEVLATDTYRLHAATLPKVHASAIVPAYVVTSALRTANGLIDVELTEDGKRYAVRYLRSKGTKNAPRTVYVRVQGRTIEGPFPDVRRIIPPAEDASASWTIADAAGTADVLATFRNKKNTPAMMAAAGSAVRITASDRDGTRDALAPIEADGTPMEVAFNPSFAADAFVHVGDGARVLMRDGLKPAHFVGERDYALLMPMRVA